MKYENLFKIHIPDPCNEDWDKMTPNEQGAYCSVCRKTVVDFSGKTDEEIRSYLLENENKKVCGRFRLDQLDETPKRLKIELTKFEFPSYLLPLITPFRVAALSLMLFATAALMSCGNSDGGINGEPKYERLAGAVEMRLDSSNVNDTSSGDIKRIDEGKTLGDISPKNQCTPSDTLKTDTIKIMLKGEIEPLKKQGVFRKIN